jgi:hypothetical protein
MKSKIVLSTILLLSLVISVMQYAGYVSEAYAAVLFFPSSEGGTLIGERRRIPHRRGIEENIENLIREVFLGPYGFSLERLVPTNTRPESVLLRDSVVYVDISSEIVFSRRTVMIPYSMIVEGIQRAVTFNFPFVETVVVTIGGEIPSN